MMQVSSHHLEALRTVLAGKVITAEDADYDTARIQWNNDIDRNPLAIARCVSPADIAAALTFARDQELEISVRGGIYTVDPCAEHGDRPSPSGQRRSMSGGVDACS